MPLPGGEADKLGNRYEGRWTIHCLIDVMDEKSDSIRIESPGEDAFEFFLWRDGKQEYHQVKRQNSQLGHWTLNSLEKKQITVLSDIWKYLQVKDVTCVFVSTQDADELGELANRAQGANSFTEFEQKFINGKVISGKFDTLRQKWNNCSTQAAYQALKRVRVETVGENFLVDSIENRLATLVEGDPKTVRIELAELILNSIHKELTAHDIWHYLTQERKYRRREWGGNDSPVLAAVTDTNNRYLARLNDIAIADKIIDRDETQTILQKLKSTDGKRALLVTGEAGVGKSVVMLQVLKNLLKAGIPVLSFRIDNLSSVAHPDDVGKQLQLPGSPATVLANIAQKRECVLVIDQLDAVSSTSGRHPYFFESINEIIQQALIHPNINLLIACRKFDLDNDHRLKKLTDEKGIAETININRLTHEKVKEVVTELNLDSTGLNSKQLDLLSIPLHLWLLSEIANNSDLNSLNFQTAKDLFTQFCNYKQLKLRERLGYSVKWTQVVDSLCKSMNKTQTLSAPERIVRYYKNDARIMASENILIWNNNTISFLHQSFFDYFFIDIFAESGLDLLEFLQDSEQHLFRRTQVRQILIHERETDFDEYLEHLEELLTSDDIRFHIKQIVFAWLGTLKDPQEEEYEIIYSIIDGQKSTLINHAWNTLRNSIGWFKLLDSLGLIYKWLNSNDKKDINKAIFLMLVAERELPKRLAELLKPLIDVSDEWLYRVGNMSFHWKIAEQRSLFTLFLYLVKKGLFDCKGNTSDNFWSAIIFLPERHPEWACEAIGAYFNRSLELSCTLGISNPLHWQSEILGSDTEYEEILTKVAKKSPKLFIDNTLALLLHILKAIEKETVDSFDSDPLWLYQCYGYGHSLLDCLLDSIKLALCSLAETNPDRCAKIVRQLNNDDFPTIQYLLNNIYIANTNIFFSQAYQYICYELSSTERTSYGITDTEIKQLVQNITSRCSKKELRHIENLILNYYPSWEKGVNSNYRKNFGYSQFILLNAIDLSRRSNNVNRRIQELTRKFGKLRENTSCFSSRTTIAVDTPSPVPESALEKMTDEQWIKAIIKYSYMQAPFKKDGHLISISAFIQSVGDQAKKEPIRFASLIYQLPNNINFLFFDSILRGIGETEVQIDAMIVFDVCKYCHQLPEKPCGRNICYLVDNLSNLSWSKEAFNLIIDLALNSSDPERELWRKEEQTQQIYYGGNILAAGINTVRGAAVRAIASLIFADKTRGAYFQYSLEQIVRDKSIAVRACAAEALIAMLNYDRDLAVKLFLKLCDTEDILLGTQTIDRFLYYSTYTHFEALKPILERMLYSDDLQVAKVGARQSCMAALGNEEAQSLVNYCLSSGTTAHRKALAQVFVGNFKSAHFRQYCEDGLIKLFDDNEKDVLSQAARCFLKLEEDELKDYTNIVERFVKSNAFDNNCYSLIRALEKTSAKLPQITFLVCDRFIQDLQAQPSEQRSYSRDADKVSQLLIRLYSQSNRKMRSQCLDLIDHLCEMNVYGLDKALVEYER